MVGNANRGKSLEDAVEKSFKDAFANGLPVWVLRQNNKWLPGRGRGKAVPVRGRGAPIDFIGAISGAPAAIECKEYRSGKRLRIDENRFPEKEIVALRDFESVGGRGFVVAAFWESGALAVYPFSIIYGAWKAYKAGKGEASVPFTRQGVLVGSVKDVSSLPIACVSLIQTEMEGGQIAVPEGFICATKSPGLFD